VKSDRSKSTFDAFISYSHRADGELAVALRRGLHQLGKPWYKRRAVKVFLDNASLSTNPALWESICGSLESSSKFILLCSPEAAASEWVAKEIEKFCSVSSVDSILPVLTSGELIWDNSATDFDFAQSTAASPALKGLFKQEPRFLDLRWTDSAGDPASLSLRDPRFLEAIADLAAPVRNIAKDELVGEDIAQHRRTRRLAKTAISALTLLLIVSVAAGLLARSNGQRATRNATRAESRRVEAEARRLGSEALQLDGPGDLAFFLANKAHHTQATVQSTNTLFEVASRYPQLVSTVRVGAPVLAFLDDTESSDRFVAYQRTKADGINFSDRENKQFEVIESDMSNVIRQSVSGEVVVKPVIVDGLVREIFVWGKELVIASNKSITVLDKTSLEEIRRLDPPNGFYSSAAVGESANDPIVTSSDAGTFVEIAPGQRLQITEVGVYATALRVLSDGTIIALVAKPGAAVLDVMRFDRSSDGLTWRERWRQPTLRIATALAVDTITDRVFVGSASGEVTGLNLATGEPIIAYANTINARITSISVNGPHLGLADSVGRVWIRDTKDPSLEYYWRAHEGQVTSLVAVAKLPSVYTQLKPDQRSEGGFASAGIDGVIAIHSMTPTYHFTKRTDLPSQVTSLRVDPASNRIWLGTPTGIIGRSLRIQLSGESAANPDEEVEIGSVASAIEPIVKGTVAVGDYKGRINLIRDGQVISATATGSETVYALAWNNKQQELYAITDANTVTAYKLKNDKFVLEGVLSSDATGQLIAVSSEGNRVAFSTSKGVEVLSTATRKSVMSVAVSFENYAEAFALDSTGKSLAVGDVGRLRFISVESREASGEIPLQSDAVSISFAPAEPERASGDLIVLVSRDHSVTRIEARSQSLAGSLSTTDRGAIDPTSDDLDWFADTTGGLAHILTANQRTLFVTNATLFEVLRESCTRFGRAISTAEQVRFEIEERSDPCKA
jgi:hypothetical protein